MTDANPIPKPLLNQVLERLEYDPPAQLDLAALSELYASWCERVPFDNVRKLIHVRSGGTGPLPGATAEDYFTAWLRHGTGGTCWSGAGALACLLQALGFKAERAIATMMVVPDLPPNHGTVFVNVEGQRYLVDTGMLHGSPLPMVEDEMTAVENPAWGLRVETVGRKWLVQWRPLHAPDGLGCRIESIGASHGDYLQRYEETRGWSPFNYQVYARRNCNSHTFGLAFGKSICFGGDGSVEIRENEDAERRRVLIEDFGLSEEIVSLLPEDVPTPPPPGSATALRQQKAAAAA